MPSSTFLLIFLLLGQAVAEQDAEELAREALELIEANHYDSVGSTRAGMEEGIAKLTKALELGIADPAAAYRQLARAWNVMGAYAGSDSAERKEFVANYCQAWAHYLELLPNDADALYKYANCFEGDERIAVLELAVEHDPGHLRALFGIGQLEIERGQVDEGLEKMRRTFVQADGEDKRYFGRRLRRALDDHGRKDEADALHEELRLLEEELRRRWSGR